MNEKAISVLVEAARSILSSMREHDDSGTVSSMSEALDGILDGIVELSKGAGVQ